MSLPINRLASLLRIGALALLLSTPLTAQNYALRFEGAQLEFPHHPIMNTGDAFTAEAWVRVSGLQTPSEFYVFSRYQANAEHKALVIFSNGALRYVYAGSPWPEVDSAANPVVMSGGWHHLAFVRRPSGDHSSFVDGVQVAGGGPGRCWSTCNVINGSPSTFIGGESSFLTQGWDLDSMRISTVDRYWGTFTPPTTFANDASCAMLLNFNEGGGSLALDDGPAQQVGVLTGAFSWVNLNGPPGNYNWILNPANGHYYALTASLTWTGAAAEADSVGAGVSLVTIRSAQENDWLYNTLSVASYPPHGVWIGLSDYAQEGVYVWRNGEPFSYSNWAAGEPNNLGEEDIVHMLISPPGQWNDATMTGPHTQPGILEWIPPAGLSLVRSGVCPGPIALTVNSATANRNVAFVYGPGGNFVKPTPPCQGLALGIAHPRLGAYVAANASGTAILSFYAPPGVCGLSVQAVDVSTCTATNLIML